MKKKNRDGGIQDVEVRKEGPEVFANLTRDAGFKIVLGTEGQSEELLKKLLNRLLPEAGIVELQYLPTEHFGTTEDDGGLSLMFIARTVEAAAFLWRCRCGASIISINVQCIMPRVQ